MAFDEISALSDLTNELTAGDIIRIKNEIGIPEGLCRDITQESNFILAMKQWKERDPYKFYLALQHIRPDLLAIACDVKWLCVASPLECEYQEEELSMKTLINLLRHEIPKEKWILIYVAVASDSIEKISFEMTLNKLVENGYLQKDLQNLTKILKAIQRNDVIAKLRAYIELFSQMEEGEFESKFKKDIGIQGKEMKQWEQKLKDFLQIQYGTVQEMLGDEELVNLKKVYIELTILKQKPRAINLEDETTYNEIAYLRKIANKEVKITPVDFTNELITYEQREPEIWCLIGNPGCGKTFLAKRTALRFSCNELVGIQYTISVPCRNTDWHSMESTRYENELEIETEFISKWLNLGLPKGPNWAKDLAKHLVESDGEGLLLILDGLDEFTRKVPFGKTFLCLLLTRQSLTKSTIILTSRPGAWTYISTNHELAIDRYYQVLGFSPENRDLYFKKQITNEAKLEACWDLMERHDEMKQLSLIPVNASLFAALLKGEDSASINTLTKLYCELTLYLIRREVARMGLQEFSRVARLSDLHPDIQTCLKRIGFIAFLGVANRDLVSEENVPLFMGQEEYPCHCLGLARDHYKKEAVGLFKKVWTFAHLTMQEFTAAHWLSNNSWTQQCLSIRYISHSTANFSLFRMLVRFLCGILSDRAAAVLSVMYRYLTPQPIQMIGMPLTSQFQPRDFLNGSWKMFFKFYFQLTAILYETNSDRITNWFAHYHQFLPAPIYFYIQQTVSPNEWICFLQSLQLLSQVQLIRIDTKFINPKQFIDLIEKVKVCSVRYLALRFSGTIYNKLPSAEILAYTDTLRDTQLMVDTKLCLDLERCNLTNDTAVNMFSPNTNQILSSLTLHRNTQSDEFRQQIANQLTALEYTSIHAMSCDYIILLALCQATQLKVLHLSGIPYDPSQLLTTLPNFSNLQEISLGYYSLLPALTNLSNLTYLKIGYLQRGISEECASLLQLIFENRNTLRYLSLYFLRNILTDLGILLNCIALCTNLVELELRCTEDITLWSNTVSNLKVLVALWLQNVRLCDTGFESLCAGLAYHPTFRKLIVLSANITSLSCDPLILLIPTVTQLEELTVSELKKPDKEAHELLQQTADEYSIQLNLC